MAARGGALAGMRSVLGRAFGRQTSGIVAVDIGSTSVKILEVRGPADAPELVRAGMAALPEGALQNNTVADTVAVAEVIRTLLADLGIKGRLAVTAVPGPSVIIKKASVHLKADEDLETLLMVEAQHFIPENLDNVSLDYHVLRHDAEEVEVLIVAVRRDILQGFMNALAGAGLDPVIVDVDYFALENMFELNYESGPDDIVALIDIGARFSSINVLRGGVSSTTGDVQAGGGEILDSLTSALGVSADEAERLLGGGAAEPDLRERADATIARGVVELADAIDQSLRFLWRTVSDDPLQMIYVTGGAARIHGLREALATRLGVSVESVNPFARMKIGSEIDPATLEEMAPALGVAAGLATRRVERL